MIKMGIDPGKINLGWAVLKEGSYTSGVLNPYSLGLNSTVDSLTELVREKEVSSICIERYVAYEGVHNPASEQILMLIGALSYAIQRDPTLDLEIILPRAADWKSFLVKDLFKKGFRNPSLKLDKKFSMAAAEFITGMAPKTDHEADAICLAEFSATDIASKYRLKF